MSLPCADAKPRAAPESNRNPLKEQAGAVGRHTIDDVLAAPLIEHAMDRDTTGVTKRRPCVEYVRPPRGGSPARGFGIQRTSAQAAPSSSHERTGLLSRKSRSRPRRKSATPQARSARPGANSATSCFGSPSAQGRLQILLRSATGAGCLGGGATIDWSSGSQSARVTRPDAAIKLRVGRECGTAPDSVLDAEKHSTFNYLAATVRASANIVFALNRQRSLTTHLGHSGVRALQV